MCRLQAVAYDWCEERYEIQALADDLTCKYVPPHVNAFYCFGGIVLTAFFFQLATGFGLTMYFRPSVFEALQSVKLITHSLCFGWLLRSVHRVTSSCMLAVLLLHMLRVYFTGGFKKPRELTWITGALLGITSLSFAVTGYSLPWDQVGYWACRIVVSVPEALDELLTGLGSLLLRWLASIR